MSSIFNKLVKNEDHKTKEKKQRKEKYKGNETTKQGLSIKFLTPKFSQLQSWKNSQSRIQIKPD